MVRTALEFLFYHASKNKISSHLWYEAIEIVKNNKNSLYISDLVLWRRLGEKFDIEKTYLEDIFRDKESFSEKDNLILKRFKKIIIVSLQENSAKQAKIDILQRIDCNIILLNKVLSVNDAKVVEDADIILYVWSANKHSNFKALNKFRHKFIYVKGTGSASIVKALEEHASGTS